MPGEPVADGAAVVAGQVAGDYGDVAGSGVGDLDRSEELLVAGDLVSLYVMLGIGAAIMLYVQFRGAGRTTSACRGRPIKPATEPAMAASRDSNLSGTRRSISPAIVTRSSTRHRPVSWTAAGNVDAAVIASSHHRIARHRKANGP
jgi:hypothetical protein